MTLNTKFITNQDGQTLLERFTTLISDARTFDALVGYFYSSGFDALATSLEQTEKIRILVGMGTDAETVKAAKQGDLLLSGAQTTGQVKEHAGNKFVHEVQNSPDTAEVEAGVNKFIALIKEGRLEIRAIANRKLHAKLYIVTPKKGHYDGFVITGSSNFSKAGLADNYEFNVELRDDADYQFAQDKFDELWEPATKLNETYLTAIQTRTWLNDTIKPYELYLKFLYEHFRDELTRAENPPEPQYTPDDYMELKYQTDAVYNAKKILYAYNGVFLSDVVGLGKTYMAARLVKQLKGRTLVIAPPTLLNEKDPGSWRRVFFEFGIVSKFISIGKLNDDDELPDYSNIDNIIVDEAHRFRNESSKTYDKLARICHNKRVILVTATPYNNRLSDILSQIALFQPIRESNIPNCTNLQRYFSHEIKQLQKIDRKNETARYMRAVRSSAARVRNDVLKYLMVRRTRSEVRKYHSEDLKNNGLSFPAVTDPTPVLYELSPDEDKIFQQTAEQIANNISYIRYNPLKEHKNKSREAEQRGINLAGLMKILLIKRLESSFEAFRLTLARFIKTHENFLHAYDRGDVYVSEKHLSKILEYIDEDEIDKIDQMLDEGKATRYPSTDFEPNLTHKLRSDLNMFCDIEDEWLKIKRDPKLEKFIQLLRSDPRLQKNKIIIFTESKDTADYLERELGKAGIDKILLFKGGASQGKRNEVIKNFTPKANDLKDDYRILITTDVLAEGVSLHRANVVVNYDIPWNPVQLMQRVGRINRIGTEFDQIHVYNFFPTVQSDDQIQLKAIAASKIQGFITLLGNDARLLTNAEEIESYGLFERMNAKETYEEEGEEDSHQSELEYYKVIDDIRNDKRDKSLFKRIKQMPLKARSAKQDREHNGLLTYFRKGALEKFYLSKDGQVDELDFMQAADVLKTDPDTKRQPIPKDYFAMLDQNKQEFDVATTEQASVAKAQITGSRGTLQAYIKALIRSGDLEDYQTDKLELFTQHIQAGVIPLNTAKSINSKIKKVDGKAKDRFEQMYRIIVDGIGDDFSSQHRISQSVRDAKREVVLSEYLTNSDDA